MKLKIPFATHLDINLQDAKYSHPIWWKSTFVEIYHATQEVYMYDVT